MGFETYKGYDDPKELRRIQILSTMLMDELDRVCGELGISYQAYGGTEIGAIRHKGFIPWDDDVDISMFREDYEKLQKVRHISDPILLFKTDAPTTSFLR